MENELRNTRNKRKNIFSFAHLAWFAVQIGMDNLRRQAQRWERDRNQSKTLNMLRIIKLFCLLITAATITLFGLFLYWYLMAYDGYRTSLGTKSEELHRGITFQETTDLFKEFEVMRATNYISPRKEINYHFYVERDHVQQWFSTNLTASWIIYFGPRRGLLWRDTCEIRFDTNSTIIGYEWEQVH